MRKTTSYQFSKLSLVEITRGIEKTKSWAVNLSTSCKYGSRNGVGSTLEQ